MGIFSTHSLSLLTMTETHIHPIDSDSLLCSISPVGFQLCPRAHAYSPGGGVGFLSIIVSSSKLLIVPPICPWKILLLPLVRRLELCASFSLSTYKLIF